MAPHQNRARPAGAEADTSTATAAPASTGASQATLMTAQELGQPVMDRLAFIAIKGGSIVVAPLVSEAQHSVKVYRVGCSPRRRLHLGLWTHGGKGFANSATRKVAPSRSNGDSPAQPMSA